MKNVYRLLSAIMIFGVLSGCAVSNSMKHMLPESWVQHTPATVQRSGRAPAPQSAAVQKVAVRTEVAKVPGPVVNVQPRSAPSVDLPRRKPLIPERPIVNFDEGVRYVAIEPALDGKLTRSSGKVKVQEMFWYGCPHCYGLEADVRDWLQTKPDYVEFERIPGTLNPAWDLHAKMFYLVDMLDPKGEKHMHDKIFVALNKQKIFLDTPVAIRSFFIKNGFSAKAFDTAMNSSELERRLDRARDINLGSLSASVPAIIVNGKYRTSLTLTGTPGRLFQVVEYLAKREQSKMKRMAKKASK